MTPYEQRLNRIQNAIALKPVDKTPLVPCGTAFNAAVCGVKIADYLKSMPFNCTINLKATQMIGNIDGVQNTIYSADLLPLLWLSEVKVPGRDPNMSDNELWQVDEKELIKPEDYDTILSNGFARWQSKFLKERLGNPIKKSIPFFLYLKPSVKRFAKAGYPCMNMANLTTPFEMLCGGRSLQTFLMDDIMDEPDKMDRVFKVIQAEQVKSNAKILDLLKPISVWIGGWRGTPSMLSPEMFERFSWPYMKEMADLCLAKGVTPIFHLDSNWDRGLEYFKQLPKGKCIMALDGCTDIRKAKNVVGDSMCIMGDVPSTLLAYGTQDEVYRYCEGLIRDIGPTGFILSSGCDIPLNAKLENVQMMGKACLEA